MRWNSILGSHLKNFLNSNLRRVNNEVPQGKTKTIVGPGDADCTGPHPQRSGSGLVYLILRGRKEMSAGLHLQV